MCKYGDVYLKLDIQEGIGVVNVVPMSAYEIVREEGMDLENPYHVQFKQIGGGDITYENYEIAHFRLLSDSNFLPYGKSIMEPARKVWKQLTLMEDAMLIHRIMRAPEKRIFKIDVGNIPPNEVDTYMQRIINQMKKTPYVDQQTGEYNLKFNMQNMLEDYFLPVRGGQSGTEIDTLAGMEFTGIEDIEYLRNRMMSALKVPKAFMGYEKDLTGKATLAAEDIRFARTVERIQRIALSELYKIALVHLYTQGYEDETLTNFEIGLTTPSIIYEQEKIALWKEKIALAKDIQDSKLMPSDWIYDNIFEFSEDQYDEYRDLLLEDMKRSFRMGQIENEGNDPAKTGKSYGTPHDLATLYGVGRNGVGKQEVPPGYDETRPVGRPPEKASIVGTQKDPLGKDRLGSKENGQIYTANSPEESGTPKGGSPLALAEFRKNMNLFKEIPFGKNKTEQGFSLLNEENIKGIE
jgi:hypothetical protein